MTQPIKVGAVAYDPKVSVIWDIIAGFFRSQGTAIEVVLFSDYTLQVDALAAGEIDIAWNSPLAWLDTERRVSGHVRAFAMRDTDRDRETYFVVRSDSGIEALEDLRGKTVALGAEDSPQATLIPLAVLARAGLQEDRDFEARRFNIAVGKHGDHVGGELDAFKALATGEVDASAMLDLNWDLWRQDGTVDPSRFRILSSTGKFDHCVFAAGSTLSEADEKRWLDALFAMSYDNPDHRRMMDLEGLKAWLPARTTGFALLQEAVKTQRFFEATQH